MPRGFLVVPLVALVVAFMTTGCPGEAPVHDHDAAVRPDARPGSGAIDAPPADVDAPLVDIDARPPADAGPTFDALTGVGTTCTDTNGNNGTCIDTDNTVCSTTPVAHLCPGPAQVLCCIPATMSVTACDESVMPTPNDGLTEEAGADGCPAGMLRIPDATTPFCIDRFEAALEVVNGDGTFTSWSPFFNPGTKTVRAVSLRAAVPQGYISGTQAQAACTAAGKRLCNDTEWLRACQGEDDYTYPYGNTRETGVCNDHRAVHPAVELFGSVTHLDSPCINQLHDTVDLTGSRTGCVTEDGAFDMMGNEHEWTADTAGTFRGGFYVDTVINGNGCLYVTTAHDTAYWDYSTGFRCCHD